jgi:hypothetical protein
LPRKKTFFVSAATILKPMTTHTICSSYLGCFQFHPLPFAFPILELVLLLVLAVLFRSLMRQLSLPHNCHFVLQIILNSLAFLTL